MGQYLSMTSYMTVNSIGSMIGVRNQYGHQMYMSPSLLDSMYSADHFAEVVPVNMTALAELLQSVQDVVFKVNFFKQVDAAEVAQQLLNATTEDYTDKKRSSKMSKALLHGEERTMICQMVKVVNVLGRSEVIDLQAPLDNNQR